MNDPAPSHPSPEPSATPLSVLRVIPPFWRSTSGILLVLAALLIAWQGLDLRSRLLDTQEEVARRLAEQHTLSIEAQGAAKQNQEQLAAIQGKLGALEARQNEFQGQNQALQHLYQDLARNRDDVALLEVEQAVTLAAQQLQLAGNVPTALLALHSADARLAALDRPQFIPLRKALARDLEQLQALPFVDLTGLSLKIETLIGNIDQRPLILDNRPSVETPAPPPSPLPWWHRFMDDLWHEIKSLVRIQRFDREAPLLLSPNQSFFLRENFKLRLLNARLALFSRDAWTYRNELQASQAWLTRHFDAQDPGVQADQNLLKQLITSPVQVALPNLGDTLTALNQSKAAREKR